MFLQMDLDMTSKILAPASADSTKFCFVLFYMWSLPSSRVQGTPSCFCTLHGILGRFKDVDIANKKFSRAIWFSGGEAVDREVSVGLK